MLNSIGSFFSNLGKEWWNRISDAPPATRNLDVCSISVFRKRGGQEEYLGNFAPELYVLANAGILECQIREREWLHQSPLRESPEEDRQALLHENPRLYRQLYRADGSRKTPFELALIPGRTTLIVTERLQAEYRFRRDRKLPLPAMISKYRVVPDYLGHLPLVKNETRNLPWLVIKLLNFVDAVMTWPYNKAGVPINRLQEYDLFLKSPVGQGIKLNINNPADKATPFEKILHYISQWVALFCTIGLAVSVGCVEWALGVSAPWLLLSVVGATYLANKCGKDFGLFDIAEEVNRARLIFTKALILGNFSFTRALETSFYLAAAGFATYFATIGAASMAYALPWGSLASTVSPGILGVMQTGTAAVFATTAALGGFAGTFATRYFWRWSFNDNRICFNTAEMQAMQVAAEAIDPRTQKAKTHLEKFVSALSAEERAEFEQGAGRPWLRQFGLAAADDAREPGEGLGPDPHPARVNNLRRRLFT